MPYIEQVLNLTAILPPEGIHHVNVEHEAECPFLSGGPCTCNPTVTLLFDKGAKPEQEG